MPPTLYYCTSHNADFLYLTHFDAHDPVFALSDPPNRPQLFVSELEFGRAQKTSICDVILREKGFTDVDFALKITESYPSITVNFDFPAGLYAKIHPQKPIEITSGQLPQRVIKSPSEVQKLISANQISMKCFDKIKEILANSVINQGRIYLENEILTSEILSKQVKIVILEHGGVSDYEPIIACGVQGCDPHCNGSGEIFVGQSIVCDIFPRGKDGYYADMTRTFVKGQPSEELRKQYQKVLEVQQNAIMMVKPGVKLAEIAQYVERAFEEAGYKKEFLDGAWQGMIHGLGHGVGLDLHEQPSVNVRVAEDKVCVENQVFTVEPGLYYLKVGGVRIEDDILVTEDGCKILTPYSYDWIIE